MTEKWSTVTMRIINRMTPDIKEKGFDPDWFLLRQRFENIDRLIDETNAAVIHMESVQGALADFCDAMPHHSQKINQALATIKKEIQ